MMKLRFIFLTISFCLILSCSRIDNKSVSNVVQTNSTNQTASPEIKKTEPPANSPVEVNKPATNDNTACYNLKRDDLLLDKKQTFAIDFKPFEKSCFVTFHDPEFDNPPLGSQFYIYQNGIELFNFPEPFGGANTTCWVDAVAFEDLNNDQLKDVIVIGKCGAKSSAYNENMVYINNGVKFVTNSKSNAETMDFSKISQIRDFVKQNPNLFLK